VIVSAEVGVNGQLAGVRLSPPWSLDITRLVRPGENRIEVLVYNTLANHYTTIPTPYGGPTISGLLGRVQLRLEAKAP
jgi:hypothetical protein